ncbi:macrophage mannose receptor 1-like 8 [Homarus americanus]|uniref:Macrophage mannose receptor 1-like 8 n=1 Tax=Homarus americanus TaxID=6706 RepID=A0A8J5K421_HOMAM|nr:macrophage mannose receptor 1-like 8 [Homarus americanus]
MGEDAEAACVSEGSHLASVKQVRQGAMVWVLSYNQGPPPTPEPPVNGHCPTHDWLDLGGAYCYLAVTDQETWVDASVKYVGGYVWTDGTGLDYINWDDGQPGNDSQNCVEMLTRKGTWVDVDCTTTRAFVCKTEKIPDVHPTPPPTSQPGELMRSLTGGVVGIVLAVVVVVAGFAFLGFYAYTRRTRYSSSHSQLHNVDAVPSLTQAEGGHNSSTTAQPRVCGYTQRVERTIQQRS